MIKIFQIDLIKYFFGIPLLYLFLYLFLGTYPIQFVLIKVVKDRYIYLNLDGLILEEIFTGCIFRGCIFPRLYISRSIKSTGPMFFTLYNFFYFLCKGSKQNYVIQISFDIDIDIK